VYRETGNTILKSVCVSQGKYIIQLLKKTCLEDKCRINFLVVAKFATTASGGKVYTDVFQ